MQQHDGKLRPVAYYSKILTGAQKNYTTTENELLAIVAIFKAFRSMLLEADIAAFTNNKNLTCENLQCQRFLRLRLFLEEYDPKIKYIEGDKIFIVDTFQSLGMSDDTVSLVGKNNIPPTSDII